MKIAYLGLGRMGSGMATRLLTHGNALTVWNRSVEKAQPFAELGATIANDPAQAVLDAELVITCLFDDDSLNEIFHEGSDALNAMQPGTIHLCVTTISPECAERLAVLHAAHGLRYVAGPVLGRPDASAAGRLVQILAGDASAIAEVTPVCAAYAERVIPLECAASVANSLKLCLNFFIAGLVELMCEGLTLGEKSGVPREVLGAFYEGFVAPPGFKGYARRLTAREVGGEAGFTMVAGRKDLKLMQDAAEAVDCPLELADLIATRMDVAIAQGMEQVDWSAIQEIIRQNAKL
jgi:3-hydroxyisobutyrate dehydrogenase-like beta-hydroxyacid dehydrogenase